MKHLKTIVITGIIATTLLSCRNGNERADGYGNFEATEITVSAESNGKLMRFTVTEGQDLAKETFIGYIDTIPLSLKRKQLLASKEIITSKSKGILSQINVLNAQLKTANINKNRIEKLIKDNAGTQKQLDDIIGSVNVLNQQINSIKSQNAPIISELKSIDIQIKQVDDQIQKCKIINPISGTVLVKYAEPNEITAFGKHFIK
jgi:HlyD family secretion protein